MEGVSLPHPADIREPVARPDNHVSGPMHPAEMITRIRNASQLHPALQESHQPPPFRLPEHSATGSGYSHGITPAAGYNHGDGYQFYNPPPVGSPAPNPGYIPQPTSPFPSAPPAPWLAKPQHRCYPSERLLGYVAGRLGADAWSAIVREFESLGGV